MDCYQKTERKQHHSNWNKYDNKLWNPQQCIKIAMKRQQDTSSDEERNEEYRVGDSNFNQCSPIHSGILNSIAQLTQ